MRYSNSCWLGLRGISFLRLGAHLIVASSYSRPDQPHVFQYDLLQGLWATEAFQRVQNLDAGQPPFCIVVGCNPFRQVFGCHRGLQKLDEVRSLPHQLVGGKRHSTLSGV